ncbi:MAG TPA: hypothetical protein VFF66_10985 [Brevundimonas sp.]|nr:hypothetical protein [Brevundimonas sp.]
MNNRIKNIVLALSLASGLGACASDSDLAAMMGAVGGMAAVGAYGGDADMMMQGAALGASVTGGGSSVAQGLASSTGVYDNVGLTGSVGQTATGGAGVTVRPNALGSSPACSMMNESNYRQVALSGGNDVQLKTMCGQAFEYYTMYKRAIAQGYSEADANRTYDAHQQAALNAISFYNNNRAN